MTTSCRVKDNILNEILEVKLESNASEEESSSRL